MSALDMALKFELKSFVKNNTVEKLTTSVMNDWEFLRPKNKETSFVKRVYEEFNDSYNEDKWVKKITNTSAS